MIDFSLLLSMVTLGVLFAWMVHRISMPILNSVLIHCLVIGVIFGLVNYFVVMLFQQRFVKLKEKNQILHLDTVTDTLTKLLNRRAFDQDIQDLKNSTFSVVFIDIDNFRAFNNQYGHDIGDLVLKKVSQTVRMCIRKEDKAYRYGGEEMVIVLKNCDKKNAKRIAEKIRCQISKINNNPYPQITVSLGIASCPEDGETINKVLEQSDQALLDAKKLGKNCTVCC